MKIMPNHDNPGLTRRNFCGGLLSLPIAARIDGPLLGTEERGAESQAARRRQIYALHQQQLGPLFDENGRWIGKSTPPIGRERLWNCLSLLSDPSTRDKANAILTRTFVERSTFPLFEIFEWSASTQLLVKNGNDLNQDNREQLQALVREALELKREILPSL